MRNFKYGIVICVISFFPTGCGEETTIPNSTYHHIPPEYGMVELESTTDTLHFLLNDTSYNDIECMNIFVDNGIEYLSFFDKRSSALLIYDFMSCRMVNRIPLTSFFKEHSLHKTSVYVKNYDSILITNRNVLYLFDSSGDLKMSRSFVKTSLHAKALLDNTSPPVMIGTKLYTGVRRSIFEESTKAYSKWNVLFEFNLREDSAMLRYNLPKVYHSHLYGYQYLYSSFCYNYFSNRFVFSFAADTNVYETDLAGYHVSYYAKSRYQDKQIQWRSPEGDKDEEYKNFLTSQAYGAIFFDSYRQRYLRMGRRKISESDYEAKKMSREQTMIIFDENFRIIGESPIDKNIDLRSLFMTKGGIMYARLNLRDEYALHFVRLQYLEEKKQEQLTWK